MAGFFGKGVLLSLFFLLPCSWGLGIDSYRIAAENVEDSARIALFIYFSNNASEPVGSFALSVPQDSEVLSVGDFYGALGYSKTDQSLRINLSAPIVQGERRLILVELSSAGVISKKGDVSEYLLIFNPPQDIADFEHAFRIPKQATGRVLFVSPPAEVTSRDDGITVRWRMPLRAGVAQPFIVRFEQSRTDLLLPILVLAVLLALAFSAASLSKRYLSSRRKDRLIGSLRILNERERVVVEEVVRHAGVSQSSLQMKFGYTKASMSKIVSKLAYREIIVKKKHGKTNILFPGKRLDDG